MSPKQNCNSSQEFPWAFHARNKNCAPPASETLYCRENGLWFPTAFVLIEFPFIREGDRSFAEHAKIWHCLWKSRCFSPVARQIPSADREQQENSKVNSTSQGRSCSSCVFWRKKKVHTPLCLQTCVLWCLPLKSSGESISFRLDYFACITVGPPKWGPGSKTNQKPPTICRTTEVPTTNHHFYCIGEKGRVLYN